MPKKKSPKQFENEFYDLLGEDYMLLTAYELSSKHVKVMHKKCENIYKARPNAILKGTKCPYCNGNKATQKTTKQFKEEVYNLVGDEYTVLGDYINRSTNIKMRHNTCGREYNVEPGNFLYKSRCVECHYKSTRISKDELDNRVKKYLGSDYRIIEYNGVGAKKSLLKHLKCDKLFKVRLDDVFHKKSGCPYCVQSRGEDYVESYLKEKGIKYIFQKRFNDLKSINYLSYDFYLPDLNVLIEYQGEQHFKPKNFGGTPIDIAKKNLKKQQYHDKLKKEYAKRKGYILLELTYKLNDFKKVKDFLNTNLHY